MWIEELDIRGYKRLRGAFRFGRGLTLVVGDNEAGKSTLHEALVRCLFGFSRAEQARRGDASVKQGCAPWVGEGFGLNAVLGGVDCRSLRAEWDFRAHTLRLRDHQTGEDRTAEIPAARSEIHLGRHLLGVGAAEFRDVCCLNQAAIEAVRRTQDLVLALQQAVESRGPDLGVEDAVRLLNEFLRVELGVHSGHLHDLPGGRLAGSRRERDALREALASCETARADVDALAAGLAEREFAVGVLRRSVLEVEQRLRIAERDDLEARLEQVERLVGRARDVPQRPLILPEALVLNARRLLADEERLRDRATRLAVEADGREPSLHELTARRRDLTTTLDGLAAYAEVNPSSEARVLELSGRRNALAAEAAAAPSPEPEPDAGLARYRAARPRLVELERRIEEIGWLTGRLLGATVAACAALALGGVWLGKGSLAAGSSAIVLAVVAAGLAWSARPAAARAPHRRSLAEALAQWSGPSLAELDDRAAEEDRLLAEARTLARVEARREAERQARVAAVEQEIVRALDGAGAPALAALDERLAAYLTACRKQAERSAATGELETVRMRILEERRPMDELRAAGEELEEVERQLAATWDSLGVGGGDRAARRAVFEDFVRRARADTDRVARAEQAGVALRELLRGESLEALADRAAEAARILSEHVERHGRLAAGGGERAPLEAERTRLEEELREAEVAVAELRTRVRERERDAGDPAELKERLAEVEARITAMERARDAIRLARDELQAAAREAHRRFAPRLNEALRRHLPMLTGGRYGEAAVDDELRIRVEAPETGRLVAAAALSRGTQDQIYFLQRLELVRMLERRPGEIPILLDDPFAHFDEGRLRSALAVLQDVAAERQVVLFTEDRRLVAEARALCPDCGVIELPPPPAGLSEPEPSSDGPAATSVGAPAPA